MSAKLTCDICGKDVQDLSKFAALAIEYQVPGRIVHVCHKCSIKINDKLKTLGQYYSREMSKDVREWLLLNSVNKPQASANN